MQDLIEKMKTNMSTSGINNYQTYTPSQLQGQSVVPSQLISFGQNRTTNTQMLNQTNTTKQQTFIVPSNQTLSRISANLNNANSSAIYYDPMSTRQVNTNNCINNYNSYLTNSTSI